MQLMFCYYYPHKNDISEQIDMISRNLDFYSPCNQKSNFIVGDFNFGISVYLRMIFVKHISQAASLTNEQVIKTKKNSSCIDLILTNQPNSS